MNRNAKLSEYKNKSIIYFDGNCNFCNSSINFIIKYDKKVRFLVAPLQALNGGHKIKKYGITIPANTLALEQNGDLYTHSTGVLRIAAQLSWPWKLFYVLILVPPFLRDWLYTYFAKHRYRWFGKKEKCAIPSPEIRARFVEVEK